MTDPVAALVEARLAVQAIPPGSYALDDGYRVAVYRVLRVLSRLIDQQREPDADVTTPTSPVSAGSGDDSTQDEADAAAPTAALKVAATAAQLAATTTHSYSEVHAALMRAGGYVPAGDDSGQGRVPVRYGLHPHGVSVEYDDGSVVPHSGDGA